ncbi:MAG TPA: hypothetical protein VN654_24110 [Vicinamibacterales bacterium]|nr:hypothetical protein [Vicinamibacterales bacterium]
MKFSRSCAVVVLALALCAACAKVPPDLTPAATRAFYGTQVIHDLDRLREVAVAAHATTPPLLSAEDTLVIVKWHQTAIALVHAAPAGWRTQVSVGLGEAVQHLKPDAQRTVAPYVVIVQALLKELP